MSYAGDLRTLVEMESPSADKAACDALARHLHERFAAAGAEVRVHRNESRGDHLELRFGSGDERPALLICHYDTVWPLGTIAARPFRIDGDRAIGPGVFDMKASFVILEAVLRRLQDDPAPRPIRALLTSDEEVGSPTSRALIEQHAREAAYVLVMEPPLAAGVLKMRRKGIGRYRLAIEGRAAHAGLEPEKGISAVVELAHQILRINTLSNLDAGTTVNVGIIRGGSAANVVPATAEATIDVRVWSQEEAARVDAAMQSLAPVLDGTKLEVTGGLNRPPMDFTAAQQDIFARAQKIAASRGITLTYAEAGGGSDANFTAAVGAPTLDGLGLPGDGAHAVHEFAFFDALDSQVDLVEALLREL